MIWTELTRLCYGIALAAHKGQLDKGGHPYIEHPLAVAKAMGNDEIAIAVALLHDVFEDTELTCDDLAKYPLSIPLEVLGSVLTLTHWKENGRTYMEYIRHLKQDPVARKVKIADLKHNMDLSRLGREATEQDWSRYNRYKKALQELEG